MLLARLPAQNDGQVMRNIAVVFALAFAFTTGMAAVTVVAAVA
jgi:hypothetical protein